MKVEMRSSGIGLLHGILATALTSEPKEVQIPRRYELRLGIVRKRLDPNGEPREKLCCFPLGARS